jgi:phage shock protein E
VPPDVTVCPAVAGTHSQPGVTAAPAPDTSTSRQPGATTAAANALLPVPLSTSLRSRPDPRSRPSQTSARLDQRPDKLRSVTEPPGPTIRRHLSDHLSLDLSYRDCTMATEISLQQLQELVDRGAQVVEVLPEDNYAPAHLPGAINLPLRELDEHHAAVLDRTRPVVVYCWDSL